MTAWFKKATVAGVAALSLALFSGGQLAAADETPTPSPTSESPSAPVTATTPAAPKSSAPADASAKEPAPETKTSAPETKPADPASPDSKATEKAAPKKKAAAKAPARTTPSDSTPSPSPQTDTKVTTSLSFAGAAQRRSAPQIAAADPEINFGVGYTQTCVPLGQDSVAITFTIENTGNTTGTAAISVAGPTKFDLGTVTLAPGESKTVGTKDMVVGDYTLTADFTDGQTRTLPIKIEACESPVTFATISSPTCATINDGVVNATIANTQATAGSFGVRFGGKTITVDVPAKGETPITLEGFAPGDHKVEILGSVDGKEVVLQEATVTVKNCITIVEVKQRYCAGPDGGSIDWTLRNDGKEEVYILAKTGDRDLLTTLLAPGAETGMLAVALPAGDYPVTFTVENQEGRRVLGTRTVTVSECPVVVAKATITRDDCFSGKATFDNSGSNVAVTYRVWDGQKKIAETKVGAGKSGTAKYTFTGRQLKVTAVDDGNDLTVVSQDFAEACEALAKPIKVKAECGHVTFTSPAGNGPVTVEYGTRDRRSPDGRFSLTGGKAKTVDTQRSEIDWVAYTTVDGKTVTQQIQDDLPVKDCVAPTPSPSSEPSADPTSIEIPLPPAEVPDAPELADTGSSTSMLNVLLGAGLLVAGAGAIALGRRRR